MSSRRHSSGPSEPVWSSATGMGALLVLLVVVVVRGVLLKGSFFNQDDYYLTSRAARAPLTWSFLFQPTAGHVQPAQQLTYWIVSRTVAFDWPAVALGLLVAHIFTLVLVWHVLCRLLPGRLVRLPLLAVVAWSPLTVATSLWWSAAMGLWPGVAAAMVAVLALLRQGDRGRQRWYDVVVCLAAVLFALAWHERGILVPALLFAVAVATSPGPGWRRVLQALGSRWALWTCLVILGSGYLMLHRSLTGVGSQRASISTYLGIVWNALARNAVPGLASGPWQAKLQGGAIEPSTGVVLVSDLLAIGLVAFLFVRGGARARWAIAMLALYSAVTMGMLLLGRAGFGRIIGLDTRYTADLVVTVVFLAIALRDVRLVPVRSWWSARKPLLAVVIVGVYGAGALLGTGVQVPHFQNKEDRAYFTNLKTDYDADPGQVIVDAPVPPGILLPLLGRETLLSNVLRPLGQHVTFDQASTRLRVVDVTGHLGEPRFAVGSAMRPGRTACGYGVSSEPTRIPLQHDLLGQVAVRIGYFTNGESDVRVWDGTFSVRFRATPGPNEIWFVMPDEKRPVSGWWMQQEEAGASAVCVAQLTAGALVH